jgi:hypothetical protein
MHRRRSQSMQDAHPHSQHAAYVGKLVGVNKPKHAISLTQSHCFRETLRQNPAEFNKKKKKKKAKTPCTHPINMQ